MIECAKCHGASSDRWCAHCGAPIEHGAQDLSRNGGCGSLTGLVVVLLIVAFGIGLFTDPPNRSTEQKEPAAENAVNSAVRSAAVAKLMSSGVVLDATWVRPDEFWISVHENGSSWQPIADHACAWIRGQGMQGSFSVSVMEGSALLNKRVESLAYARCN